MKLTPKQEKFCCEYIMTGNASEAYRLSYAAGNMKATSIHANANKLMQNTEVALRIKALQAPVAERAQITLADHINRLQQLSAASEARNQFGAAITAEMACGKVSGLYVDKVQMDVKVDMGEVNSKIAALMAKMAGGRASRR